MQARWGHHGQGPIIALAPSSVQDMFDLTIEAFNLSETWRSPVLIMAEETVAHMRERLIVPDLDQIRVVPRKKPQDLGIAPEDYQLYGHDLVPPLADFGEGYNINHVSLAHHPDGNVARYNLDMHRENVVRLHEKIEGNVDTIARVESRFLDDCEHVLICFGAVARTGLEAVMEAREVHGVKIGFLRLVTLWPFAENQLRKVIKKVGTIFVPEMNLGMMAHPITETLRDRCDRVVSIPSIGALHSPETLLEKICEAVKC
jgi:2-oxoglutarate ferredoxin oxidoreductase subunit alpha